MSDHIALHHNCKQNQTKPKCFHLRLVIANVICFACFYQGLKSFIRHGNLIDFFKQFKIILKSKKPMTIVCENIMLHESYVILIRSAKLQLLAQGCGCSCAHAIEDVIVAFFVALCTDAGLLQKIVRDVTTADVVLTFRNTENNM